MRTRKFLLAATCVLALAAAAAGVVLAHQRSVHAARERALAEARETVKVSSSKLLSCHLQHRRFRTLPRYRPTGFCMAVRRGAKLPDEDILISPRPDPKKNPGRQFAPMILSSSGKLLWYWPRPGKVHDLKVVTYNGQPALAFFQKFTNRPGYYVLLDRHYREIARVRTGHGYWTDLHELWVTPKGTAYVSANATGRVAHVGKVVEYVVQEVDIASGKVLFEWHSLKHAGVRDSYQSQPKDGSWDYFHGNSIDPPTPGDNTVLISSRNTSSIYAVNRSTGKTEWIFGGKRDQFHLRSHPSWFFCAQHDVHRLANGDIELFDNGGTYMHGNQQCPVHPARSLVFKLDVRHRRATLVKSVDSKPLTSSGKGFFSGWVGSARPEPNGDTLIDWGGPTNRVTEVSPNGTEKLFLKLEFWSYRGIPATWVGLPGGRPALVAKRKGTLVHAYASWNGATQIAHWQLLAGSGPGSLAPAGAPVAFRDLETGITATTRAPYVAVRALDALGKQLGESAPVRVG